MKRIVVAGLLFLVPACGDDGTGAGPTTTPATPTTEPGVTAEVDWAARTVTVAGFDGPAVDFCEGEAPMLCVGDPADPDGVIELVTVPGGAGQLAGGRDAWVDDFADSLAADRREGCDPDFVLTAEGPVDADVAGHEGFRYGFTGAIGDRVVERVVGFAAVVGDDLHLLVLNGLADDGCLARESELPLAAARELEPVVAALAAGSAGLPGSQPDG